MKYIIDIEDEYTKDWVNKTPTCNELCMPISVPNRQRTYHVSTGFKLEPYTEPDRKAIEDEVWEFVRIITDMTEKQRIECFGGASCDLDEYWTYQDAKTKYEAWLKQKDEIRVGDEVETESGNKACVLYENPDGTQMFVFKVDGTAAWWSKCAIHKTGKNHPEIAELLKKMRGAE